MRKVHQGIAGLVMLLASAGFVRSGTLDFNSIAVGTTPPAATNGAPTPFSITDASSGIIGNFSVASPGPAGAFVITNPIQNDGQGFLGFSAGNYLYQLDAFQNDPGNSIFYNVKVDLSSPITGGSLNFALNNQQDPNATFTLLAFSGSTQVGSFTSNTPTESPDFGYSYGSLNFDAGQAFDSFLLTTNTNAFALDDLNITPAISGVPEPATTAFVFFGIAGLIAYTRRRQQARR